MKKAIILITALAVSAFVLAQDNSFRYTIDISQELIREIVKEIKNAAGVKTNFYLEEANVDNIEASISHRKKYISYNHDFLRWISSVSKNKWPIVALFAHEIGHHVKGHTSKRAKNNRLKYELEADEFAGFVLNKLGATCEQAQYVMKYIARTKPSRTHPAQADRMDAIEKGWNAAANNTASHKYSH